MAKTRPRKRRPSTDRPNPPRTAATLLEHRQLDQVDPDAREHAIRVFLLGTAGGHSPDLSFHAQCLLAGLYRATYPILMDHAGLTDRQRQEVASLLSANTGT